MKLKIGELVWRTIFDEVVGDIERKFGLCLIVDQDVVDELTAKTQTTLASYGLHLPNEAKIAGHLSFWIRRLKPISHCEKSERKWLAINEAVGLYVGISLCEKFSEKKFRKPSRRIMLDWITSMRVNSHSPQGTALAFEVLTEV
ncbi:MAG: hypothetical protein HW380_2044 [Magnetococcales bacterium]|nr:hypothetical protein [Magnetococcales bacterium]